jgi:hypothetical protein
MAKLIIEGLTPKQAETLADWFEGRGEQDAIDWFDCRDVETPITDVQRKGGCMIIDKKTGDVTLFCK